MSYRSFSNGVIGRREKRKLKMYAKCEACGVPHPVHGRDYGFRFEYDSPGGWAAGRLGLCKDCAKRIIPLLKEAEEKMFAAVETIKAAGYYEGWGEYEHIIDEMAEKFIQEEEEND